MKRNDWFRRTTWTHDDEREFFERLARSRTAFHKAQYLRIQAGSLAATGQASALRVALGLLDRLCTDFPEPSQLASAHLQAAQCHEALGNVSEAVRHFRLALAAQTRNPQVDPGTSLEFAWFIFEHQLTSLYDEAIGALDASHLAFPVQYFKANAIRAFVAKYRDDHIAASQYARKALESADLCSSPFRYHRPLGLVGEEYRPIVERLSSMARG
jgi:tetratricopeptide (TPR) repeat protein